MQITATMAKSKTGLQQPGRFGKNSIFKVINKMICNGKKKVKFNSYCALYFQPPMNLE